MTEQTSWPPAGSEPTAAPSAGDWFSDLANRASGAEVEAAPAAGALVVAQPAGPILPAAAIASPGTRRANREAERADAARSRRAPRPSARTEADLPIASSSSAQSSSAHGRRQASAARRSSVPRATATVATSASPRVSGVSVGRAITSKGFPALVMASVAMLLVGTTVPANALFDPKSTPASLAFSSLPSAEGAKTAEQLDVEAQAIEGETSADLATSAASRDEWGVTSYAEMLRLRYGSTNFSYMASGSGPIRWPFAFAAPIASGFGERSAPCRGCATYHRGLDFDAGYGAPIGAIADGVVTAVGWGGAYGYLVVIEHVINGQKVESLYAHMIDNSSVLQVGDTVVVGELVGALGNTGLSTGPHLHLEIHVDDVPIDPFAWLTANAG